MSLASEIRRQADDAVVRRTEQKAQDLREQEESRTKEQSRIFERAREVYDLCVAVAKDVASRGGTKEDFQLHRGRFDRKDFADRMNLWNMAALGLRENGFSAELWIAESDEIDEMTGGPSPVYTPYIRLSWEQ